MTIWGICRTCIVASATIAMGTGLALAQEGRQGGGGGRGGFGGGFGAGMMGAGGLRSLVRIPEVQKEISLGDEEKKKLEELEESLRGKVDMSAMRNLRDASPEERAKVMATVQAKNAEVTKEAEEKMGSILDPTQLDRLIGLLFQQDGAKAVLASPAAFAALTITADQKKQMEEIQTKAQEELRGSFRPAEGGGPPDFAAMREKMDAANKATDEKHLAVLTADQKTTMEKLKGAKFTFPERRGFGGPGGGAGGPGGRPGRPNN